MSLNCSVQSKISCVFKTEVLSCSSTKRKGQNYKVVASKIVCEEACLSNIEFAKITEKIDGTCCFVDEYKDLICLWARLDRKQKKGILKKFQQFQKRHNEWLFDKQEKEPIFNWNYPDNMKEVPDSWKPALNVNRDKDGDIYPDQNGHVPGWVPICTDSRQYCWHSSVFNEQNNLALILKQESNELLLTVAKLSDYKGKTMELIGTNINNNPYQLGTKQNPFHVLIEHGSIAVNYKPDKIDFDQIKNWLGSNNSENNIEGIVWHCKNGKMFKIHRHHLDLPWPINKENNKGDNSEKNLPFLSSRLVKIDSSLLQDFDDKLNPFWLLIKKLHLQTFESFYELSNVVYNE